MCLGLTAAESECEAVLCVFLSVELHSRVHLRSELPGSAVLPNAVELHFGFVRRILGVGDVGDVVVVASMLFNLIHESKWSMAFDMHFILAVPQCRSDCLSFGRRTLPN